MGGVSGIDERKTPRADLNWKSVGASLTFGGSTFHSCAPLTAKEPSKRERLAP